MDLATTMFPHIPNLSTRRVCPLTISRRNLFARTSTISANASRPSATWQPLLLTPRISFQETPLPVSILHFLWLKFGTPVILRTEISHKMRDQVSLGLLTRAAFELDRNDPSQYTFQNCYQGLRKATKHLIRHARNHCSLKYGKVLLHNLVKKKPCVALKYICDPQSKEGQESSSLYTHLFVITYENTGVAITNPIEFITKVQ